MLRPINDQIPLGYEGVYKTSCVLVKQKKIFLFTSLYALSYRIITR